MDGGENESLFLFEPLRTTHSSLQLSHFGTRAHYSPIWAPVIRESSAIYAPLRLGTWTRLVVQFSAHQSIILQIPLKKNVDIILRTFPKRFFRARMTLMFYGWRQIRFFDLNIIWSLYSFNSFIFLELRAVCFYEIHIWASIHVLKIQNF